LDKGIEKGLAITVHDWVQEDRERLTINEWVREDRERRQASDIWRLVSVIRWQGIRHQVAVSRYQTSGGRHKAFCGRQQASDMRQQASHQAAG